METKNTGVGVIRALFTGQGPGLPARIALAVVAGLLLVVSMAPFGLFPAAWFAFVPFLFAIDGQGLKRRAVISFAFGFVYFVGTVYWVINSMYYYGGVELYLSVPAMLLLSAFLALYPVIFGLLFPAVLGMGGILSALLVPSLWVATEYARSTLFTGFPWLLAGYSQVNALPVLQAADLAGVWGISFALVAVNVAVFLALTRAVGARRRHPYGAVAVAAAIVVFVLVYGFSRAAEVDAASLRWRKVEAWIAQGSVEQTLKWDPAYRDKTIATYRDLTAPAALSKSGLVKLVVWPESALPAYIAPASPLAAFPAAAAAASGSYLLTGALYYTYNPDTRRADHYNSAFLFSPDGEMAGRYDKNHLVPFGEYVPRAARLLGIHKLTVGLEDYAEGTGSVPIGFGHGALGVGICYEAVFPALARESVLNGATLLVNLTNDGWFGRTSAPHQHLAMAVMRAVENRIYLVRAANTGISAFVDPAGRVLKRTALFERTAVSAPVGMRPPDEPPTLYTRYGDFLPWASIAASGLAVGLFYLKRNRRKDV